MTFEQFRLLLIAVGVFLMGVALAGSVFFGDGIRIGG